MTEPTGPRTGPATGADDQPRGPATVERPPWGRTAQRLSWKFLPREVRESVEARLGEPVIEAVSQDAGFTPGFASVVATSDGRRAFVKAASKQAQQEIAAAYAEEARKHALFPEAVPRPTLLWVDEDDRWVVLGFEAVDGHPARRPWRPRELDAALDLCEEIAAATATVPASLRLRPIAEDLPLLHDGWQRVAELHPGWPHREEAAALAAAYLELPDSSHPIHSDLRDDNILITGDGRALACDWNWPCLGPVWQDTVDLLVAASGDGLDSDALLSGRHLTAAVPPEHIDAWLAAFCGFMLVSRARPPRATSPYLHTHADWYAEASWAWLAARRGWT